MTGSNQSDEDDDDVDEFYGYDQDDEEFEDDEDEEMDEQRPTPFANLGSSAETSWGPPPDERPPWGAPTEQPAARTSGLFSGEATGRFSAPVGPSAGSEQSFEPPVANQEGPFASQPQPSQEVPPWIRDDGPANRPVPPWARGDDKEDGEFDPDDFYIDDDDDDEQPGRNPEYGFLQDRPTSWEEMSRGGLYEDDDEDEEGGMTEREEKIKRYAVIGAGAAGVLLVFYMIFSFLFGGGGSSTTTDGNTIVAEIESWSDWPDPLPGYVVKFPSNPSVSVTAEGRKTLTSSFEGENYRVLTRGIDPKYWESLAPADKINFINSYLTEEFPGIQALLPASDWKEATLGGKVGRKMVFRWEGTVYTIITTFQNNHILATMTPHPDGNKENVDSASLLEKEVGDSKKLIDSWRWLPQPDPPAESEETE